jgi:hypothetical protein
MKPTRVICCAHFIVFATIAHWITAVPMAGYNGAERARASFEKSSKRTSVAEDVFRPEDCESEISFSKKLEPRPFTTKVSKQFMSESVRQYIRAQHSAVSPTAMVWPPRAYSDLVVVGKPAVPFLLEQLRSDDELLREAAWQAIVEITNKRFISTVDAFGKDRNPEKWNLANIKYSNWWQQNREKSRTQWLIEDVLSPDFITKKTAIIQLGSEQDLAAIPILRKSLEDSAVQFYSAGSLASLGDRASIPYLVNTYLTHQNEGFRRKGICFLLKFTGQRFQFDPSGTESARESSIQKWNEWLRSNNNSQDR